MVHLKAAFLLSPINPFSVLTSFLCSFLDPSLLFFLPSLFPLSISFSISTSFLFSLLIFLSLALSFLFVCLCLHSVALCIFLSAHIPHSSCPSFHALPSLFIPLIYSGRPGPGLGTRWGPKEDRGAQVLLGQAKRETTTLLGKGKRDSGISRHLGRTVFSTILEYEGKLHRRQSFNVYLAV